MIELEVEDEAWRTAVADLDDRVARAVEAAAVAARLASESGVCILLTDDEAVLELNARFRGRARSTNVLSFPAPMTAAPHLGDIALAFGVCAAEARSQHKPLGHHLSHLLVHGLLHLVGYDHESDAQAEVMEDMEREVLRGLGIADPYAQRDADAQS